MKNNNCDKNKCVAEHGEVRLLPLVGGANIILCKACFADEIAYRKDRNKDLGSAAKFDLPTWESLEVYSS